MRLLPDSLEEHLAFCELYPDTEEGKKALATVQKLLNQDNPTTLLSLPSLASSLSSLINRGINTPLPKLSEETLTQISLLSETLPNRKLAGFKATTEEEVLALSSDQIDLAKGLFLSSKSDKEELKTYEALIDLMSLSLKARIKPHMSDEEKINLINTYIFFELGYRFPPQSIYAKDVDIYTFLPSVLDSRRGVCLGVSLLYLCLAERLDLPLSIVTPPGHIFVRYKNKEKVINIETTARGIPIESEHYLSLETKELEERTLKETIGFVHMNQASVFLQRKEYDKALASYREAEKYTKEDPTLKLLLGLTLILLDQKEEGERLLKEVKEIPSPKQIADHTLIDDYFEGHTNKESIALLFYPHDHMREDLLKKRDLLESHYKEHPKCRTTLFGLASVWLELHREREALELLKTYHEIDSNNLNVEYYLSSLYLKRQDFPSALKHLKQLEALCQFHNHHPKALKELKRSVNALYPL